MSGFMVKKNVVARALAMGETRETAAAKAGITVRSVYRFLANPAFRQLVAELRSEFMSRTLGCMAESATRAAMKLSSLLDKDDPGVQLRVARAIIGMAVSLRNSVELDVRIGEIEAELARKQGGAP